MKTCNVATVILGMLICIADSGFAQVDPIHPQPSDVTTTPVRWEKKDWGEFGKGEFLHAPFPSDERTTGITRNGKDYPAAQHYQDSTIAFAIPEGADTSRRVDFVVIHHGWFGLADTMIWECGSGEILKKERKDAIIVVPQGPRVAPDSCGGKLEKPGGFANMMNEIMTVLKRENKVGPNAKIGNIIVSGFSGGGRPMAFDLDVGGLTEQVKEAWIFDGAYGQRELLAKYYTNVNSTTGPQVLYSLFTDHLADGNVDLMSRIGTPAGRTVTVVNDADMDQPDVRLRELMKQNEVLFMHTALKHNGPQMYGRFFGPMLSQSRFLRTLGDKK